MSALFSHEELQRYQRQLVLPEITPAHQKALKDARLLVVGAGGLGAAALPILAGAGIGHITLMDHDEINVSNLHRQTLYKTTDTGESKAAHAAAYIKALNPHCIVNVHEEKLTPESATKLEGPFDLLFDGTDNFKAKSLLNNLSLDLKIPLLSASVERFSGFAGLFAGFAQERPCYHCLFPVLPDNACSCVEGGILGSVAALAGTYEAHLALCYLLGIGDITPGTILTFDAKTLRLNRLHLDKDLSCSHCETQNDAWDSKAPTPPTIELTKFENRAADTFLIDVRGENEAQADPVEGATNIPLHKLLNKLDIPTDQPIGLVCATNKRNIKAASLLKSAGFENITALDRS